MSFDEAWASFAAGRFTEAEQRFGEHVGADSAEASYGVGLCGLRLGDLEGARGCFLASLKVRPGDSDVTYYLGVVHEASGDIPRAVDAYLGAIAINPQHKSALLRVGDLARRAASMSAGTPARAEPETSPHQDRAGTDAPLRTPPVQPSDWRNHVGVASHLERHTESWGGPMGLQVLSFTLGRASQEGGDLGPIGVQLEGLGIRGSLADGDWVEVDRRTREKQGWLLAKELHNLSRGTTVRRRHKWGVH